MTLKAENIAKKYIRKTKNANFFYALQKTDFEIRQGEFIEIVGRSGSGKSTFLSIMCGILKPSEGRILIGGTETSKDSDNRYDSESFQDSNDSHNSPDFRDIYLMDDNSLSVFRNKNFGVIPQGQSGLSSLSVLENVMLPAMIYEKKQNGNGKSKDENSEHGNHKNADSKTDCEKRAVYLLEKLGIAELKDEMPENLSGGEMRRMAIARSLINKPAFVFADEPTSDLDDENTQNILSLLKSITKEENAGVLLVTHETDADKYADKIYKMDAGVLKFVV